MYWEAVLREVLNKNTEGYFFAFTNIKPPIRHEIQQQPAKKLKTYFLIKENPSIYLTEREGQCVALLFQGLNMRVIGQKLGLSRRTIEFYVNNIKKKLGCKTKKEILSRIQEHKIKEMVQF